MTGLVLKPLTADLLRPPPAPPLAQHPQTAAISKRLPAALQDCFLQIGSLPVRISVEAAGEEPHDPARADAHAYQMDLPGGPLHFTLSMDRALAFALADLACGGAGMEQPFLLDRPPSRFEEDIRDLFVGKAAAAVASVLAAALLPDSPFAAPKALAEPPDGGGPQMVFRLLANVAGYDGELRVALSAKALAEALGSGRQPDEPAAAGARLEAGLTAAEVELVVALPEQRMSVADLSGLQPGQFLKFAAAAATPVRVSCAGAELFTARLARAGGHFAVQIEDRGGARKLPASSPSHQ